MPVSSGLNDDKKTVCSACRTTVSGFLDQRKRLVWDLDAGAIRTYTEFKYAGWLTRSAMP